MSEHETVMVEGTECYLFPVPLSTKEDRIEDAKFFANCAYHRMFFLNQRDQQRSRELSLAITNLQQAQFWLKAHENRVRSGIPLDDDVALLAKPEAAEND